MLEYTRTELSEKELEDRIIKYPQLIENGLQYLEHQRPTVLTKAPELTELLTYINKENIREIAKRILDEAQSLSKDITVDPLQWGKSVKYKGNVIFYWQPRQAFIRISTLNEDGEWTGFNIEKEEEYSKIIEQIKSNINKYDENA